MSAVPRRFASTRSIAARELELLMLLGFADPSTSAAPASGAAPAPSPITPAPTPAGASSSTTAPPPDAPAHHFLVDIMPWAISILLHLGVIVVLAFTIYTIQTINATTTEMPIVPDARWSETPGMPMGIISEKINLGGGESQARTIESRNAVQLTRVGDGGRGTGSGKESGAGSSSSMGDLIGSTGSEGGGPAGKANPFALGSGNGPASGPFHTQFVGSGGNARDIAYVIDASGSLIDTMPFVLAELRTSIDGLSPQQTFTVVFFQDGLVLEPATGNKKPATPENKQRFFDWMRKPGNVAPSGRTVPLPAIKKALSYQPQLIFLLSDCITGQGQYEVAQDELLKAIDKANTPYSYSHNGKTEQVRAKINTIQFLSEDPLVKYGLKRTMEEIARQSGGVPKFVSAADLGIEDTPVLRVSE